MKEKNQNKLSMNVSIDDDAGNIVIKDSKGKDLDHFRMIQPIMFKPCNQNEAVFADQQPCTAPLNASAIINLKAMYDTECCNISDNKILNKLNWNNKYLMQDMCYNYIASIIFSNFCSLLDTAGPKLVDIIRYIDIKDALNEILFDDNKCENYQRRTIKDILNSLLSGSGTFENSFIPEHKYSSSYDETNKFIYYATLQLKNAIYSMLMNVVDISVNKTYFGGLYFHNQDTVIKDTVRLLNLSKDEIDKIGGEEYLSTYLAFNVKQVLMSLVEQMMSVIINPAIDELIGFLPVNNYYIFNGIINLNEIDKHPDRFLKSENESKNACEDDHYYDF